MMINIDEIELKISKLNLEKDILFHKHQIDGYKSSLSDYDTTSNYHDYLLKNIEINLLEMEMSKIKLEEIDKKFSNSIEDSPNSLKYASNNYEDIIRNLEKNVLEIEKLDIKLEGIVKKDEEIKRKINYFNYISTIATLFLMFFMIYSVFFSNKESAKNQIEHKKSCIGESCFRID